MILVAETPHYKAYWHDEDKSIMIGEVYKGWTWTDAHIGLKSLNEAVVAEADDHEVFVIINLTLGAQMIPRGGSAITNIRNLLKDDPSRETLTIFVSELNLIATMMKLSANLYGAVSALQKYHFVTKLEEAFSIIETHKLLQKKENPLT